MTAEERAIEAIKGELCVVSLGCVGSATAEAYPICPYKSECHVEMLGEKLAPILLAYRKEKPDQ